MLGLMPFQKSDSHADIGRDIAALLEMNQKIHVPERHYLFPARLRPPPRLPRGNGPEWNAAPLFRGAFRLGRRSGNQKYRPRRLPAPAGRGGQAPAAPVVAAAAETAAAPAADGMGHRKRAGARAGRARPGAGAGKARAEAEFELSAEFAIEPEPPPGPEIIPQPRSRSRRRRSRSWDLAARIRPGGRPAGREHPRQRPRKGVDDAPQGQGAL